jgi:DNA-directed RNA polymerase subunit RPC12/RpoP
MPMGDTWTIVLRCYRCATRFTLPHLTFETITTLPLVAACPRCGTQPVIHSQAETGRGSKMHEVLDMSYGKRRTLPGKARIV